MMLNGLQHGMAFRTRGRENDHAVDELTALMRPLLRCNGRDTIDREKGIAVIQYPSKDSFGAALCGSEKARWRKLRTENCCRDMRIAAWIPPKKWVISTEIYC